uniref:PID domain-containing protein n=1 Tax=Clastoptera arizonana TaxID=38151 RepID=A0A1B6E9S0_9HEMI
MESEHGNKDFRERTLRSLKQGLGRLWKRRSVTITEYDPSYKVVYLGNVLTGWAKGEGCVEKPLCTLWKNYTGSTKPDVHMKVTVTQSGLKAVTKEHGLTEYWSHRVTYCAAPSAYPKVFCWVYRHEGRKLKQELRCHAVLCSKEVTARKMVTQLNSRLAQALIEFKRDKLSRQNARLSLANSVYENPSLPRRKILLSTGSHNYRPPLERSKSAPKLMAIEESLEEEEEAELRKSMRKQRGYNYSDELKRPRRVSYAGFGSVTKMEKPIFKHLDETMRKNILNSVEEKHETLETSDIYVKPVDVSDERVEDKPFANDDVGTFWVGGSSFSLHSSVEEEDDLTTDGEDSARLCSISDDDLDVRSKLSEDVFINEDEELCKSIVFEEEQESNKNDCFSLNWRNENLREDEDETIKTPDNMVMDCDELKNRTNSLVRDRKKMFEKSHKNNCGMFNDKYIVKDDLKSGCLVQARKMMFEAPPRNMNEVSDKLYSHLTEQSMLDLSRLHSDRIIKGYLDLEEDSTPSLQSISSGSDTSSTRLDQRQGGVKPNYDLDSLSEEDSDESGYVESVPQDGADDKERDLPHHQLMKNCILKTKTTRCVQV